MGTRTAPMREQVSGGTQGLGQTLSPSTVYEAHENWHWTAGRRQRWSCGHQAADSQPIDGGLSASSRLILLPYLID